MGIVKVRNTINGLIKAKRGYTLLLKRIKRKDKILKISDTISRINSKIKELERLKCNPIDHYLEIYKDEQRQKYFKKFKKESEKFSKYRIVKIPYILKAKTIIRDGVKTYRKKQKVYKVVTYDDNNKIVSDRTERKRRDLIERNFEKQCKEFSFDDLIISLNKFPFGFSKFLYYENIKEEIHLEFNIPHDVRKLIISEKLIGLIGNILDTQKLKKLEKDVLTFHYKFLRYLFEDVDFSDTRTYDDKFTDYVRYVSKLCFDKDADDLLISEVGK